jgi:hypothetical protein
LRTVWRTERQHRCKVGALCRIGSMRYLFCLRSPANFRQLSRAVSSTDAFCLTSAWNPLPASLPMPLAAEPRLHSSIAATIFIISNHRSSPSCGRKKATR